MRLLLLSVRLPPCGQAGVRPGLRLPQGQWEHSQLWRLYEKIQATQKTNPRLFVKEGHSRNPTRPKISELDFETRFCCSFIFSDSSFPNILFRQKLK